MNTPTFTSQEAQYLVEAAQAAPLRNMQHAAQLGQVLERFKAWYEHTQNPPENTNAESRG